jgi:hypothetical protein
MAAPNNSAPAIWVLDKLFSNSNCSSAMKVLQFTEEPLVCIKGDIFIINPGPQPEKAAKAAPKERKASEERASPFSEHQWQQQQHQRRHLPYKAWCPEAAKRKAPKKRQAEEEQAHPQRTSSNHTQKRQKAAGSTAAAAAAAAAPDDTTATSAKYAAAAAQSEQDEALAELRTAQ